MNEVYPLFSQPVFLSNKNNNKDFTEVLKLCENLEYIANSSNNFTSTNTNILDLPDFFEIKQLISEAINEYVTDILKWTSNEIYITQSWLNINPPGTGHHHHYHYNSIVSCVFYLKTLEKDSIMFYREKKQLLRIEPSEFNIWNSDSYEIPVVNGSIVVFPSQLTHDVKINQSKEPDENRISLAVNTFVKGTLGGKKQLTYLDLK